VINATPRPLYPRQRDPVPIVQVAGWDPGPVCAGAENFASTGIRSAERPARSESLYDWAIAARRKTYKISRYTAWTERTVYNVISTGTHSYHRAVVGSSVSVVKFKLQKTASRNTDTRHSSVPHLTLLQIRAWWDCDVISSGLSKDRQCRRLQGKAVQDWNTWP
jgi:hypothetical protein